MRLTCSALAAGVLGWCIPQASIAAAQPDALSQLTRLSIEERQHPRPVFELGIGAAPASDLISPDNSIAFETLEQVLERVRGTLPTQIPPQAEIDEQSRLNAMRHYVEAKSRQADGDSPRSISLLEQAAALDPNSPTIYAELGHARVRAGRTQTGLAVLDRAVTLGDRTPDTLYTIAKLRLERGELELALPMFVGAWDSVATGTDPALEPLITASLGITLLQQGSVLAGSQAIQESLRFPTRLSSTTNYLADYGTWVRQRKALIVRGAEAFTRVGEVNHAADLYAMADDTGTFNPDDLLTRLVAAHVATGHPVSAALAILEAIASLEHPATDRQTRLLSILSRNTNLGPELVDSIDTLILKSAQSPPSIRSRLLLARAACLPEHQALNTLRESAGEPWATQDVIRRWLEAEPNARSVVKHAAEIVESAPTQAATVARLLFLTRTDSAQVYEKLSDNSSLPARLLSARIAIEVQRPDLVTASGQAPNSVLKSHVAGAQAIAAAARGDWAAYDLAVIDLTESTHCPSTLLAEVLASGQRFNAAIDTLSQHPRDLESLRLEALLHQGLGRKDEAAQALEQAIRLDPTDESLHRLLLESLTMGTQDQTELGVALRRIRVANPSGRLIRQLVVQNLVQSRMLQQAQTWLDDMLNDGAPVEQIVPLLASVWRESLVQEVTPEALAAPIERLTAFHEQAPGSLDTASVLARLLVASQSPQDALAVLNRTAEALLDSPKSSRAIEQLLRTGLDREDEAKSRAQARLDRPTLGIDESLELAGMQLGQGAGEVSRVVRQLHTAAPEAAELTPRQQGLISALTDRVINLAATNPDDAETQLAAATLTDLAISRGIQLAPAQHERRIGLLTASAELDEIVRASLQAIGQHPTLALQFWILTGQGLINADRADDAATALAEGVAQMGEPVDPNLVIALVQTAGTRGSAGQVRGLINRLEESGILVPVVETVATSFSIPVGSVVPGVAPERVHAELAYLISLVASTAGRQEVSDELLELAIELDSTHPWAANDLGYKLAESGEDLHLAETLLVAAATSLPNRGSVLDSLGWLRYKLGVLENDGEIEGAVTLLTRASQQPDGLDNATIFMHLGDALWRVEQHTQARAAWAQALQLARSQQRLAVQNQSPSRIFNQITRELDSIRARLNASTEDDNSQSPPVPPIAPIPGLDSEPDPTSNP